MTEPIPAVCFIEDVARILRTSVRTINRLRRAKAFPIAPLPSIDRKARWSGAAVEQFLVSRPASSLRRTA